MDKFKQGCTLIDQVYKEGESTWGCKSGVLDVDDVMSFVYQVGFLIDAYIDVPGVRGKIKQRIDEILGTQS